MPNPFAFPSRSPGRTRLAGKVAAFLTPAPVMCFAGALVTDIIYSRSAEMQWANFSAWLLLLGIVSGALTAIVAAFDVIRAGSARRGDVLTRTLGTAIVLILGLLNNFVHSRDAWTSVVPAGLTLSALTVLAMIATAIIAPMLSNAEAR